ncbi:MAG: hypothetical protein B6D41_22250 [Chloroflexi bacterium UTCFX4]|nr:MAG: hypothetical protein B6D41_22250 [Chloroflexi bacterium UTCFX4]
MIESGLEIFLREHKNILRGQRVGLVTHAAAVTRDFISNVDALRQSGVPITALFGPEHGWDGAGADAMAMADATDARTGLPIYSLYGVTQEPNAEMLQAVDALVFDMQDVGARFYTFISTLDYVLRAAEKFAKAVIVLDRPNPINGIQIEGPLVDAGLQSFISHLPVPIRHGLTMGELARWLAATRYQVEPQIIRMRNWRRAMWFDETGLPWIPLSPGMPRFETTIVYPGMCLLEGTNVSEGRGTALPFEICGAPWLDGYALARQLNRLELPGARFRAHAFTPVAFKYRDIKCDGVQIHVTDRNALRPVYVGLHILAACRAQNPERFEFLATSWEGASPHLDLLVGTARARKGLSAGEPIDDLVFDWETTMDEYRAARASALLYA